MGCLDEGNKHRSILKEFSFISLKITNNQELIFSVLLELVRFLQKLIPVLKVRMIQAPLIFQWLGFSLVEQQNYHHVSLSKAEVSLLKEKKKKNPHALIFSVINAEAYLIES